MSATSYIVRHCLTMPVTGGWGSVPAPLRANREQFRGVNTAATAVCSTRALLHVSNAAKGHER